MGREIRRVDLDWEHPRYTERDAPFSNRVGQHRPLHDNDYAAAAREWIAEFEQWQRGEHPSQKATPSICQFYWEYAGNPPESDDYRAEPFKNPVGYQVYETVSEGTPVSPVFATKAELVEYLVAHGDFWDQKRGHGGWRRESAERFVNHEYAPSFIVSTGPEGPHIAGPGQQ